MYLAATIAVSHLLSRRRQTLVSLLGVMLGVAFFLAVSSLMQGSDTDFIKRLVDNSPHITVYDEFRDPPVQPVTQSYPAAVLELRSLKPRVEIRGIRQYKEKLAQVMLVSGLRVAPVLVGQAIVNFAGKDLGVTLNGVVPDLMRDVSTIDTHMLAGNIDALSSNPNGLIIGTGLANKLAIGMGKNLTVTSSSGVVRTMKIVGLFRTGNAAYDDSQTFLALKRAQSLLARPNTANRLILKLEDPDLSPAVAKSVEAAIGYKSQSWQEASEDIMSLLKIRRIIMYSVVAAILIVASFGIYNVISTVVMEKTRDIAILKSIGFHANDIRTIFLIEGAIVGVIGSVLGTGLGVVMMGALSLVEVKSPFNTEATPIPLDWGILPFALGIGFAMASSLAAAFLPAHKGARVNPVDILRGAA